MNLISPKPSANLISLDWPCVRLSLLILLVEEHVIWEVILLEFVTLQEIIILLVAILLDRHFSNQELGDSVRDLAELLKCIFLVSVRIRLIKLDKHAVLRYRQYLV